MLVADRRIRCEYVDHRQVVSLADLVVVVIVRGPTSAVMYWDNREQSRATFLGEWTRSGDKYIRDDDGYYVYCGRRDDMLKVGGIYVSPFEVEGALQSHPEVLEAAVERAPEALVGAVSAYRAFALAHPHLYRLMTGRPLPRERLQPGVEQRAAAPLLRAVGGDVAFRAQPNDFERIASPIIGGGLSGASGIGDLIESIGNIW